MRQGAQHFADKAVIRIAIFTLVVFVAYGAVITFFPLLPFWIDEWLLIDNLKFKTSAQLWGPLEHTQQFPRVYLQLIKIFAAALDYSYASMRLPSFLTHCCGLALLYKLSARVFRDDVRSRFLWMMMYVSFNTSIHYFTQLKQYTMEMALSLVGIWQLLSLAGATRQKPGGWRFTLMCASFAVSPFFSYTYPIVIAPVYVLGLVQCLRERKLPKVIWLPLIIGIASTSACYILDTRHVLADSGMQDFWKDLLMKDFSITRFAMNTYALFCSLGSGDLFGNIFGLLGVSAALYASYKSIRSALASAEKQDVLLQYCCLLLWLMLGLFVAGKLPLGTWRLNSFAVPALGYMIICLLSRLGRIKGWSIVVACTSTILFLALAGNVFATMAELTSAEHARKLAIYKTSRTALEIARRDNLPVFTTSVIAYPFEDRWQGDWILKTHPAYFVSHPLRVYAIVCADSSVNYLARMTGVREAILLDGDSFRIIRR